MIVGIIFRVVCIVLFLVIIVWLAMYFKDKWEDSHPQCDACGRHTRTTNLNCFTKDAIKFDSGWVTLEQAIKRNMFKGYVDRNWEVFTEAYCDKCLRNNVYLDNYGVK